MHTLSNDVIFPPLTTSFPSFLCTFFLLLRQASPHSYATDTEINLEQTHTMINGVILSSFSKAFVTQHSLQSALFPNGNARLVRLTFVYV